MSAERGGEEEEEEEMVASLLLPRNGWWWVVEASKQALGRCEARMLQVSFFFSSSSSLLSPAVTHSVSQSVCVQFFLSSLRLLLLLLPLKPSLPS